jgi:transmembrane sensor
MTDPTDDIPWETLAAFLACELPPEEDARVHAWLAADSRNEELLAAVRVVWEGSAANRRHYDAEAMLRRLRVTEPVRVQPPARRFAAGAQRRPAWLGQALIAASLAGLAVGGWWLTSRWTGPRSAQSPSLAVKEYRTPRGQRLGLKLADGSSVMLGPASTLRVAAGYGAAARSVELDGEAYFEVRHDAARPFSVRTERTVARDLGTRFVVRAYRDEPTTDVVVAEGKVAVGKGRPGAAAPLSPDSLLVQAGDRGRLAGDGQLVLARRANLDDYLGWTEGRLVFHDTPLPEALRRISRWYDVDIRLVDSAFMSRTLTASFHDEPAPEVVRLVAASFGLRLERDGSVFVLRRAAD